MTREIGDGKSIVRGAINKIGGEGAAHGIAPTVSQFGLQDAGGAGADKHAHALSAVFVGGGCYGIGEAILHQSEQREPVVSAVKVGQVRGQLHGIDSRDFAHKSCQVNRIKRARNPPTTLLVQRSEGLLETATDAAGRGEMREPERVQRKSSRSKGSDMLENSGGRVGSNGRVTDFTG